MDEKIELTEEQIKMLDAVRVARAEFRGRATVEGRNECLAWLIKEEAELRIGGVL